MNQALEIVFIGGGNMAGALIGGLIRQGVAAARITVIDPSQEALTRLRDTLGVRTASAPEASLLRGASAIVLAVKPHTVQSVAAALRDHLHDSLVISIAAGIRANDISRWLGGYRNVVRAMPNTPALVNLGMTAAAPLDDVPLSDASRQLSETILGAVGELMWCKESQLDAVTGISGSGPAYVFYFIEALEAAALELGFDAAQSRLLALKTFTGAAQLAAQTGEPIAVLRERVTSKGGTTAAALASFAADDIGARIARGALAATQRARQMADEYGQS